jgi:inositol hexakisphosphate/diphosphoinositol-pentakisphosphate kinase
MGDAATTSMEEEHEEDSRIVLGICAMDKKATSKPMQEILRRLPSDSIRHIIFGNDTILNKPIEEWPRCDVLVSFYSTDFPLAKAEAYAELVHPHVINDLPSQRSLLDRRLMYKGLQDAGVNVPNYAALSRDDYNATNGVPGLGDQLEEFDDCIVVNGKKIAKPFVEKPVDAEDHNIHIYYPMKVGGGCKHLFRKVGDKSSEFYPNSHTVRRGGSFIYEEFINTQVPTMHSPYYDNVASPSWSLARRAWT